MATAYSANQPNSIRNVRYTKPGERITPATGNGVRNVSTTRNFSANDPRYQTTDEEFRQSYAEAGLQPRGLEKPASKTRVTNIEQNQQQRSPYRRTTTSPVARRRAKKLQRKKNKLVALVGSIAILPTASAFHGLVMVPLSIINTVLFVMLGAYYGFMATASGIITGVLGFVGAGENDSGETLQATLQLNETVGFDLLRVLGIDVQSAYYIFLCIIMAMMAIMLFSIYLVYRVGGVQPLLGGKKASLKSGMFVLAVVGYLTPVVGVLPCFWPWVWAVRKYPN